MIIENPLTLRIKEKHNKEEASCASTRYINQISRVMGSCMRYCASKNMKGPGVDRSYVHKDKT